jgi:hypothetical protein
MRPAAAPDPHLQSRHRRVALSVLGVVVGMIGMSYAAVPLYEAFCRATGFGGVPQIATTESATRGEKALAQVRSDKSSTSRHQHTQIKHRESIRNALSLTSAKSGPAGESFHRMARHRKNVSPPPGEPAMR